MRNRLLTVAGLLGVAVTVGITPARLTGQSPAVARPATTAAASSIPRMPDGHPDLQGMYDLATLTPIERPAGMAAVLTPAEAAKLEAQVAARRKTADDPSTADRTAPPVGGDGSTGAAGGVGGYNNFWLDPGSSYTVINGQKRSSIVVDPPTGRVPAMTAEARARLLAGRTVRTSDQTQRENDPGLEPPGSYDNPEQRPLGERCLLAFGSSSGPPALPTYFYNNLHQIVQTRDSVMILTEMVHDARIVRMNAEHLPSSVRKWNGDSVGRWEGDILVVDTTNFTDKTRFRGATENLRVVERFTRLDAKTLLYRFTVEDPATWATPWTGEYAWPATTDQIYEYACHENNYALEGILRGARFREAEAAKKR
ncbi:MAG TPA: hypothetical protein VI485_19895 [Vicinamibacterales bacterium]|nr:hypothetical protein [Vicinamibacterales bacterium]